MQRLLFASRVELVAALVPPGRAVAVVEPTDGAVTAAILTANRRYVDLGRDAALQISTDGWAWALEQRDISAIWVLDPELPTCTRLARRLVRQAQAAGMTLVLDQRLPSRPLISAETLRVHEAPQGVVVTGPDELLLPLRRAARAATHAPVDPPALLPLADTLATLSALGLPVIGAHPQLGVAFRNPGVASQRSAQLLGLPTAGSAHWTWRDLVYLGPEAFGPELGASLVRLAAAGI